MSFTIFTRVSASLFNWGSDLNKFSFLMKTERKRLIFLLLVGIVRICVFSWGNYYFIGNYKQEFFYRILLLFVISILLLLTRRSIFSFVLGWEGLGITSFILIIFYQNWIRFSRGLLTLITNRLGDVLLLWWFTLFFTKWQFFCLWSFYSLKSYFY